MGTWKCGDFTKNGTSPGVGLLALYRYRQSTLGIGRNTASIGANVKRCEGILEAYRQARLRLSLSFN